MAYITTALAALLLVSSLMFAYVPANLSLVKSGTFQIPANAQFSETVYVEPGQYVIVNASGRWRYDPRPQFETGPDGLPNVFTTFKPGMLQGKFGDGDVFPIGSYWEGYVTNRGRLALGIYEPKGASYASYQDNVGNLTVTVRVYAYLPQHKPHVQEEEKGMADNGTPGGNTGKSQQEYDTGAPESGEAAAPGKACIAAVVLFISAIVSLAVLYKHSMK
ncbi:MAG: hypothetical protein N3G76_02145 [Candidatus Micrarchaeota archaeon]|nr:hypothetical protein [Candidatus Micrarchaeota archaeon]